MRLRTVIEMWTGEGTYIMFRREEKKTHTHKNYLLWLAHGHTKLLGPSQEMTSGNPLSAICREESVRHEGQMEFA